MLGPLCTNIAITKLFVDYMMHSFFAYRQFNSNFTCPPILLYELTHSRNRGTIDHNVRLPSAWQVLVVYASLLIMLTPPEYGAPCDTALRTPLSSCDKFVRYAALLREELNNCSLC
ncbi:hypothetical protein AVEN_11592-1 [Araneus ventricosus]|uniref:Uncharacterized protein n=1 Tax=Araneus ventricosus TaxID=182803 RepID=A0A4Y2SA72_ARAVE|nr:hypothetical protein AVEN_93070-1 [Araneus ventricosus]GBN84160.1 hypothetical protein AVEN_11592-1 [Araneus ventricosus]